MKNAITLLGFAALLALIPLAVAAADDDEPAPPTRTRPAKPDRGARFLERFDLDGDGRVTWEEFQKVRSGFARLDADKDGAIDAKDLEAVRECEPRRRMRGQRGQRGQRGMRGMRGMRGQRGMPRGPGMGGMQHGRRMGPPPWMRDAR